MDLDHLNTLALHATNYCGPVKKNDSVVTQSSSPSFIWIKSCLQPDWMDSPYGIWKDYPSDMPGAMNFTLLGKATHAALHPGIVQHHGAVLVTLALDGSDTFDGFSLTPHGNAFRSLATNLVLPRDADGWVLHFNGNKTVVDDWSPPPAGTTAPFALRRLPANGSFTLALRVQQGALAVRHMS